METISLRKTLQALRLSFETNRNDAVQQATHTLAELSMEPGYLCNLVEIVTSECDQMLVYAAMAQLKNQLRERWKKTGRRQALPSADRVYFLERVVEMNVRMMHNEGFFKLLKDLVVIIADSAICLLPQVLHMLDNSTHLKPCLNVLLGISEFYRFQSSLDKNSFFKELEKILPSVLGLVHKGEQHLLSLYSQIEQEPTQQLVDAYNQQKQRFEEILYMAIKFVYKCICAFLPLSLVPLMIEWALIAIGRLSEENQQHNKHALIHPQQCGRRGTDMFNYFHGKKWSAKFMVKFVEKVLISRKSTVELSSISDEFYRSKGKLLESTLLELLTRPKPNSVRFYEIYLIDMVFQKRPQLLGKHTVLFLFEILPKCFLSTPQELSSLQNEPTDFLISESYQGHESKNVKLVATALWVQLAFSDSFGQLEGGLLLESLQKIDDWLFDERLQIKQVALYLLARISFKICSFSKGKEKVRRLLNLCVPAVFEQSNLLLQVRGFELIKQYPLLLQQSIFNPLIKMILTIFRESLSGKKNLPLAIYGGMALQKLLYYGVNTEQRLSDSDVRTILKVLLELIKTEELDQLTKTLLTLAESYSDEISVYSVELANHLFSTLEEAIDRAQSGGNHYHHVSSILSVLEQLVRIVNSSNAQEFSLFEALSEGVVSSIQSLLSRQSPAIVNQYIEGFLKLLSSLINSQTKKTTELSLRLSFPYIVLVAGLSPLQPSSLQALQNSHFSPLQKKILARQDHTLALDTQICYELLRNYLKFLGKNPQSIKILRQDELSKQIFCTDFLNQFLNIVYFNFRIPHGQISPSELSEFCKGRYLSTHVLCSVLENHKQLPAALLRKIMQIMIINLKSEKLGEQLVNCNFMLFCAWLVRAPQPFELLEQALSAPANKIILRFMIPTGKNLLNQLKNPLERRRAILAFSRIIELSILNSILRTMLHFVFTWQLYLLDLNFARSSQDQDLGISEQGEAQAYELEYEIDEQSCEDYKAVEQPNEFMIAMRAFKKLKDHDMQLFREHALNANYYSFLKLYELARLDQDSQLRDLIDEQ